MNQQAPSTYNVDDWIRSTKGMRITASMEPALKQEPPFTRANLEHDLRKVSRKIKR